MNSISSGKIIDKMITRISTKIQKKLLNFCEFLTKNISVILMPYKSQKYTLFQLEFTFN